MVSAKFIISSQCLVMILVMLYPHPITSTKYYLRGPNGSPMFVERGPSLMSFTKETYDGTPSSAENGYKRNGVVLIMRKMMAKRVLGMVKEEVGHVDDNGESCSHRINNKTIFNVKCSFRVKNNNLPNFKSKMDDFVAFNADYNVPRPHPPKNN